MPCNHDILRQAHPLGRCVLCDTQAPVFAPNVTGAIHAGALPRLDFEELAANAEAASVELSKRKLSEFVRHAWHVLEPNTPLEWSWHIESIADHVQWMLEQWMGRREHTVENMVVNVPPGSMKSLILSVFAPAWMWLEENDPSWKCMVLSGAHNVVKRDARKMRTLIKSKWYRETFNIQWDIDPEHDALTDFSNTAGGIRHSQTQNSAITGERYDSIFLDDPNDVKDISKVKLDQVKATWLAAGNRLNDMRRAIRIVIQQRTHEGDLTGIIMNEAHKKRGTGAKETDHLCIPMEYLPPGAMDDDGKPLKCACKKENCDTTLGKNDPRTEFGEILHPERNTPAVISGEKIRLGPLGTAGQLNQRPSPLEGGMFKRSYWGSFDALPRNQNTKQLLTDQIVMSVDSTFGGVDARTGAAKGSSRVAIVVVAGKGATRYVMDCVYGKFSTPETKAHIKRLYDKWKDPHTGEHMIKKTIIENKGNGPTILAELGSDIPGMIEENPITDKMSRANAVHPQIAAHNVKILRDAIWEEEFKNELGVFPNGKYDDIVDALTQALINMGVSSGLARTLLLCAE